MPTVTIIVVSLSAVFLAGGGFLAGRAKGRAEVEMVTTALEVQSEQIQTITESLAEVSAIASRPVVIDAEIRESLAETPPQCRGERGAPLGLACAWATCLQYGQSSAQRPECREIEKAYLASVAPDRGEPSR